MSWSGNFMHMTVMDGIAHQASNKRVIAARPACRGCLDGVAIAACVGQRQGIDLTSRVVVVPASEAWLSCMPQHHSHDEGPTFICNAPYSLQSLWVMQAGLGTAQSRRKAGELLSKDPLSDPHFCSYHDQAVSLAVLPGYARHQPPSLTKQQILHDGAHSSRLHREIALQRCGARRMTWMCISQNRLESHESLLGMNSELKACRAGRR